MKRTRAFSRTTLDAAELLGAQVAAARRRRRWTAAELAERAGITAPTLAKVERGDPTVGLGVAFDVATLVGVPLFFAEPNRLAAERAAAQEVARLLPRRVVPRGDEVVDDDF